MLPVNISSTLTFFPRTSCLLKSFPASGFNVKKDLQNLNAKVMCDFIEISFFIVLSLLHELSTYLVLLSYFS